MATHNMSFAIIIAGYLFAHMTQEVLIRMWSLYQIVGGYYSREATKWGWQQITEIQYTSYTVLIMCLIHAKLILRYEIQDSKIKIYIASFQMALELGYLKGGYANFGFAILDLCCKITIYHMREISCINMWSSVKDHHSIQLTLATSKKAMNK